MIKRVLPKIDIFRGLSRSQTDELLKWFQRRDYPAMQIVFREGEIPNGLYILCKGTAAVVKSSGSGHFRMADIEAPSFFGEMGLLSERPRTATIRAQTDIVAGLLPCEVFAEKLRQSNPIALLVCVNLARLLSERLAMAGKQLAHQKARSTPRRLGLSQTQPRSRSLSRRPRPQA